jgi:hypothetical protein
MEGWTLKADFLFNRADRVDKEIFKVNPFHINQTLPNAEACAMKKYLRLLVCIGIFIPLSGVFASDSWAGPFEHPYIGGDNTYVNAGWYGGMESYWDGFAGDIPAIGWLSAQDHQITPAWPPLEYYRHGEVTWEMGYQLTDNGFSVFSDVSLTTSYEYWPGYEPVDPGFMYAFSGYESMVMGELTLSVTPQTPAGTIIPFVIQIETSGTPWEFCDWEFTFGGVTVNQDSYDLVIFNLIVGDDYDFRFVPGGGYGGNEKFRTQNLVEGSLESGFQLNFVQLYTPVPIPGAIWLLGSGLVGVIGLKRKYLT